MGIIESAEAAGREPAGIILPGMASWAADDEAAMDGAHEWEGTLVDENYTAPVADPAEVGARGSEVPDTKFKAMGLI